MKKLFLLIISAILFIGAGCTLSNNQNLNNTSLTSTNTVQSINKAKIKTPQERSYDFCEANGNQVIIRFNKDTQASQTFCRFSDTTECDALEYMAGRCGPGKGSKIYPKDTTPLSDCPTEQKVVCGDNGKSYGNSCLAEKEKAQVVHEGACTEEERLAKVPVTTPQVNTPTGNGTAPVITKDKPDWLNIAISFITSVPARNPRAFMDKCLVNNSTVYFVKNDDAILYNENGEAICYPNNDINNSCPGTFDANFRKQNCIRIWTDNR